MTYLKSLAKFLSRFFCFDFEEGQAFLIGTDQCPVQNERLGVKSIFDFSIDLLRPLPYKTPSILYYRAAIELASRKTFCPILWIEIGQAQTLSIS